MGIRLKVRSRVSAQVNIDLGIKAAVIAVSVKFYKVVLVKYAVLVAVSDVYILFYSVMKRNRLTTGPCGRRRLRVMFPYTFLVSTAHQDR